MTHLDWRPLLTSRDRSFVVKGHELAQALIPDTQSRFALVEVRCLDAEGNLDVRYRVRDAATVSDDEVRRCVRPKVVFEGDYDDCLRFARERILDEGLAAH